MAQRVALVTGSGRGIGRGIAERLARSGQRVVVADVREDSAKEVADAITAEGGVAIGVGMDVTEGDSVAAGVRAVEAELGPIEIVVNNAGWDEPMPFVVTDEPFWEKVVQINYLGVVRVCRHVLPGMIERRWGRVVNIGSDAARVGSSLEAVYAGAKGGVIAFTKTVAREAATKGITANVVCPGPTMTPLIEESMAQTDDAEKLLEGMKRAIPMKRLGEPLDIAVAVDFFASDDASFITGQTLSVSGGLTMA